MIRVWATAILGVVSVVAVTFWGVYFLTDGTAWWEWLVLGVGIVAGIASGVLAKAERKRRAASQVAQGGAVEQQSASDQGTNISINADHGSVAAYHMGEVHLGQQRHREERQDS